MNKSKKQTNKNNIYGGCKNNVFPLLGDDGVVVFALRSLEREQYNGLEHHPFPIIQI